MGFLDKLFSTPEVPRRPPETDAGSAANGDQRALERYRYLVRTAPPEAIEQAHREAFEKLSPEQRAQVLRQLAADLPEQEQKGYSAEPQSLARLATRTELTRPGAVEQRLGAAPGIGSMILGSMVGSFVGSAIAHQFLGGFDGGGDRMADSSEGSADSNSDSASNQDDTGADSSGGDDFGGGGDDFGGGDFGDV